MGKKTSSRTIFQKNKQNIWNVKYSEKKDNESSLYSCVHLEIEKFVKKIFKDNGFLLNCCKISLTESKLQLFVSYVLSLHALKIPKNYPQLLGSTLFPKNIGNKVLKSLKGKSKNNFREKIDFTTRVKKFLMNKITVSEKRYRKTFLAEKLKRKSELVKNFDLISNYILKEHKYSKLNFLFHEIVQINGKNLFCVRFQKLKLIKIFLIYFHKIEQEQDKLKNLIYQRLINHYNSDKLAGKNSFLQYYLKYVKSITKNELCNEYGLVTLPINKSLFSSRQVKIKTSQKISFSETKLYNFLEKLIESLNIFTQKKMDITLVLHETKSNLHDMTFLEKNEQNFVPHFLNKEYQFVFLKKNQLIKKIISQLRQYKSSVFFEETIQLVFLSVYRLSDPKLLTRFIASQFKSKKNHYFFFRFIRKVLSLFSLNKLFKIKSIKIIIKGRINGSKRSKKRSILIGKRMPLMLLDSNIKYSKSTIYGPHGTFGVKTWINQ